MTRPKVCVRFPPLPTDPSRTLRRAEGRQVTATAIRPSTGSVNCKENECKQVSVGNSTGSVVQVHMVEEHSACKDLIRRAPRPQLPAKKLKKEQNFNPALGEKLPLETPISASISSTFPGAKDLQATAPAVWPSTLTPAKEALGHGPGGEITLRDVLQQFERARLENENQSLSPAAPTSTSISTPNPIPRVSSTFPGAKDLQATAPAVRPSTLAPAKEELGHGLGGRITLYDVLLQPERARLEKANQDVSPAGPASASISTAAVAVAGKKPRAARGLKLSHADLVSDAQLLLKEKADKLGVSLSFFKNRRNSASLGRWQGRQVRAEMKREEAQTRRA